MTHDIYDLKGLCAASGVTPRTVHFYIQQGLLPAAGSAGPGAKYGAGHAARLKLIKLLQKEHLPLAEIRRRIEPLDDGEVLDLLEEQERKPAPASAVDYIRGVLGASYSLDREAPDFRRAPAMMAQELSQPYRSLPERSRWDRITLAPDVELHVRRPLTRSDQKKIETLVQMARDILTEE
ncbi:MAG: MerR family transcriptional regulator [Acidobacteria bacterium]|nr:MerR family transcriptional regulator [Acidobacteriota bacterium]